jgi:hypothetical protein
MLMIAGGVGLWWYMSSAAAAAPAVANTLAYNGNPEVDYGCEIYPGSLTPQATVQTPRQIYANPQALQSALEEEGYSPSIACQLETAPSTVPWSVRRGIRQAARIGVPG